MRTNTMTIIRNRWLRNLLFLLILTSSKAETPAKATIEFRVMTDFGEVLPYEVKSLIRLDASGSEPHDFAHFCHNLLCASVPGFAPYSYVLRARDIAREIKGTTLVSQSRAVIVVSAGPRAGTAGDSDGYKVVGTVSPLPKAGDLNWVSLDNPIGVSAIRTSVDSSGRFTFEHVPAAKYLLLVFHEGALLHIERVEIRGGQGTISLSVHIP